jgi:hypothetical protein
MLNSARHTEFRQFNSNNAKLLMCGPMKMCHAYGHLEFRVRHIIVIMGITRG